MNGKQIAFIRTLAAAGALTRDEAFTVDETVAISPDELEALVEMEVISRVAPYR